MLKRLIAGVTRTIGVWLAKSAGQSAPPAEESADEERTIIELRPSDDLSHEPQTTAGTALSWALQRILRTVAGPHGKQWQITPSVVLSVLAVSRAQAEQEQTTSGPVTLGSREGVFVDREMAVRVIAIVDEAIAQGRLGLGDDPRYSLIRRFRSVLASVADTTRMRDRAFVRQRSQRDPVVAQNTSKMIDDARTPLAGLQTVEIGKEGPFQTIVFNPRRGGI